MRLTNLFLSLLLLGSFMSASKTLAAEKELEKLQGDWTAQVETDQGGKTATMTVTGKKIRFDGPTGKEWYEGTFDIDETTKPKRISVLIEDCAIEQFKKQTVEGIYRLEGKTWTIAATAPGSPEGPSGFDDEKASTIEFEKDI